MLIQLQILIVVSSALPYSFLSQNPLVKRNILNQDIYSALQAGVYNTCCANKQKMIWQLHSQKSTENLSSLIEASTAISHPGLSAARYSHCFNNI